MFEAQKFQETVAKMTRDDIDSYYETWIRPNNSTLIITGDITMKELKPKLEKLNKIRFHADTYRY